MKMLTEDEMHLQVGMRLQLDVLRYLDIKVKEIKTYKHFLNCSLETVKIENLLTY